MNKITTIAALDFSS
jgi:magnesium-transporting ATPase (P-type)